MNKAVTFLAKIGFWQFVILFSVLALVMSEILILIHSYLLTGYFFDKNLLTVGFTIPLLVGITIFPLIAFLLSYLRELQDDKDKIIALQKKTQKKLEKSESYQRAILDSFPFFVWLKDTNSDYLAINMPVAKAVGLDNPSEFIGKNDLDFFPKDLAEAYRADDKEIMQTLQKKELEELIECNGERIWHQTYKAPILDKEGNLFGTVGFARDITKDKEAEEELKLMKYALDHAEEAVYLTDKDGCFKYVSDGSVRQLDYTKEEFKSMGISDIDSDFNLSSLEAFFLELKQNSSLIFRTRHKNKKGTMFPVEINANYIEYRGREYSLAFVRDITRSKQIEDNLKLSASVFTSAREGIVITDANNNIIDVNDAFVKITGYPRGEVLGKNPRILQSGHNNEEFYTDMWESLHSNGVWRGELLNRKKSGEEYVENSTISAVYDENGVVKNYVAIFTDITLQKQQQQKLEYIAHHDMLTNLPNRVLFIDRMHQAMAQAVRRKQLIAVIYIDIDGFKDVNDTYGHEAGDKLLVLLAEKMQSLFREGDTISRIGGDEFIALLVDVANKVSITSFLKRLLDIVSEEISINGFPINVSASIGVTFYPQQNELNAEQIIKQADEVMYQAKLSGKNKYVMFTHKDKVSKILF
ncbi:MAG: hypothetical protein A2513_11175 [Sulfurimonas sp. RIFOXYD12_FULL_33_39]|uniref:sensor domain-containing protein n=1 Tax=unclassified Sulfurimonas TaxID=2623549 RepID=UPI0008B1FCE2|nr:MULTISPECIES: PAS domain S-box protein [unclassified Sulfurimonas]OHE05401.1 MAG: hypothetical protein A3G74_07990 [Sulfurimonas sp. RIFCSPLOWO2_12_FULL_34_6]OHE09960.1 MAG: hypothetical protein A2513_11175 [Sulfurimonas sp. RIFOXYD12_FULL_33_39]OHE13919.1 MAG: hypothetical protein A2530_08580 [Sulfurimonas sp. RIFOXYD2_FULL_34_21]DAB27379.1 MAG TPA: diguanylate cyclase [Sulfurimonas sp. UBA10385]